jgi:hypothetical protein
MISLPLFDTLDVENYGLYPGSKDSRGLHVRFLPGLTLVIGANGLGKSTIVLMLLRMCSGPVDLSGAYSPGELGYGQLGVTSLGWLALRTFAARVNDEAVASTASLGFSLGETTFKITRRLQDLTLTDLEVDGEPLAASEQEYQRQVTRAAGLSTFIDWLLLQRFIVIYGDNRPSLVWDKTAQRQILRVLFISAEESAQWLDRERDFLQKATQYRNRRAFLAGEQRQIERDEARLARGSAISAEIEQLTDDFTALTSLEENLLAEASSLEEQFTASQLSFLQTQDARESTFRRLEHSRLQEIQAAFPDTGKTTAYLLGQILTDSACAICGSHVPDFAALLQERLANGDCVLCGSSVSLPKQVPEDGSIDALEEELVSLDTRLRTLKERSETCEEQLLEHMVRTRSAEERRLTIEARLRKLNASLPVADRQLKDRKANLASIAASVAVERKALDESYAGYRQFTSDMVSDIAERKDEVKAAFTRYAKEFLLEDCDLIWDAYKAPMGQINEPLTFHAFEVNMGGGGLRVATRRERAGDVSESQREFIDLAFRMALISVAGVGRRGTLVIDTPESSLDAVFAPRAARILAQFGIASDGNRLIVTSNLVDGNLIPTLLDESGIHGREDARIVDLIALAEPTAAVRELRRDYDDAVDKIFAGRQPVSDR